MGSGGARARLAASGSRSAYAAIICPIGCTGWRSRGKKRNDLANLTRRISQSPGALRGERIAVQPRYGVTPQPLLLETRPLGHRHQ